MAHTLRTKFKDEIVAEFLMPENDSKKVIIFADGMPSVPNKKKLLQLFSKLGFWVFHPRYRGSWESSGQFLDHDPTDDILDVIEQLPKGFKNSYDNTEYKLQPEHVTVIGASFGGPAAILSTKSDLVDKAIAISPVVDWPTEELSVDEPMSWLEGFVNSAFGNGYRFDSEDWARLSRGEFYNPATQLDEIKKEKVLVVHTMDDTVVLPGPILKFIDDIDCESIIMKSGGHVPKKLFSSWFLRRKILRFLNK